MTIHELRAALTALAGWFESESTMGDTLDSAAWLNEQASIVREGEARLHEAIAAFEQYSRHPDTCRQRPCTCGLEDRRESMLAPSPPAQPCYACSLDAQNIHTHHMHTCSPKL
jgi:hypothetical protein